MMERLVEPNVGWKPGFVMIKEYTKLVIFIDLFHENLLKDLKICVFESQCIFLKKAQFRSVKQVLTSLSFKT